MPEIPNDVRVGFEAAPPDARAGLLRLRELIFEVARETQGVGELTETLKWGQPAYLTDATKAGTTIRLGLPKDGGFALYTHCQTSVMSEFQVLFPDTLRFDGNRAVMFHNISDIPEDAIRMLIQRALTYHLRR